MTITRVQNPPGGARRLRALRCPVCQHEHPTRGRLPAPTFACAGCRTALRAPARLCGSDHRYRPGVSLVPTRFVGALIWALSFPIGLIISGVLARAAGLLTSNGMADLAIGTGLGRYARLFVFAPFWALIVTLLVTLLNGVAASLLRVAPQRSVGVTEKSSGPTTESDHGADQTLSPTLSSADTGSHGR